MHASEASTAQPLPGDPGRLEQAGAHYVDVAAEIRSLSRELAEIADSRDFVGEAAEEVLRRARGAADSIDSVVPRYETTAGALRTYAVQLSDAQAHALAAIGTLNDEADQLWRLYDQRQRLQDEVIYAQSNGDDAAADDARLDLARTDQRIWDHEHALDTAMARFHDAEAERDAAADRATALIHPVLDQLNDSFLDNVSDLLDGIGEFLDTVQQWIKAVLERVLLLFSLETAVFQLLALALLAAVALLAALVSNPLLITLLATGALTPEQLVDAFLALGIGLLKVEAHYPGNPLWMLAGEDAHQPTPPMRFTGATVRSSADDPYGTAFTDVHQVDAQGANGSAVVQVVRVGTDADGKPIWRVIAPSTQDWEFPSDGGAPNDLESNLVLMLTPEQQAAYERMVLAAMAQAGIGPDDPVMLVGFSQSGILAGKLASDPDCPFNIEAIVVAGAPIDAMSIPPGVSVLAIQHTGDPVHRLDGAAPSSPSPSWVTIQTDPLDPSTGLAEPSSSFDPSQHDAVRYAATATAIAAGRYPDDQVSPAEKSAYDAVTGRQSKFFSSNETYYTYEGAEPALGAVPAGSR